MADEDHTLVGTIAYWWREKHYRHMYKAAQDASKRYTNDPVLKYFSAVAIMLEGRISESMRELEPLVSKQDVNLCSILALTHAHQQATRVDQEAVGVLRDNLKSERKQGSDKALYLAAHFLVLMDQHREAKAYADRALRQNPNSSAILALKGWVDLYSDDSDAVKKSVVYFDQALKTEGLKSPDAYFGKMRYLSKVRNYIGALDLASQAIVAFSNFMPGFIEKMKLQLALQDWEQAVDTANRALEVNPRSLQAKRYIILELLCKDGNYSQAADKLAELLDDFDVEEPQNAALMHDFARIFVRVSGRNSAVLQQTYAFQEKVIRLNGNNAEYMAELGYELLVAGKAKDALKCYKNAMGMDDTILSILGGMLHCQVLENQIDDAASQLEFLAEVKDSLEMTSEMIYLNALVCIKRNDSSAKAIALLNKAIDNHFKGFRGLPLGCDYFLALNPNFLTQVLSDYLTFAPQTPVAKGQPVNPVLERCLQVIEPLCKAMPGLLEGLYLMAKAKFLAGDVDGATGLLQHCLEQDRTSSDCHILMAQIHLQSNNFQAATQSLEVGLSYNFEVREHPVYHLIKARILKKQGELDEALKILQQAMLLPGVKTVETRSSTVGSKKKAQITINDRVSLYIELADTHRLLKQQPEAAKVMQDAINAFQGSGEEVRITIANADLALARGDVDSALEMLRSVGSDQPYFIQAREKMADIYLTHRKDKKLYAACYRELAEKCRSQETNLLLGDAYVKIQEPDKAIEVYEAALKNNPKDPALANKIAQALLKTHQYGKAVNYYEAALKQGSHPFLRHDLADLLMRLKQYDKAEKILLQVLEEDIGGATLETLSQQSRYRIQLAKLYELRSRHKDRVQCINIAREIQDRVVSRTAVEQPENLGTERKFAAEVACKSAEIAVIHREFSEAIRYYREALSHSEHDGKIMLALAKLYLATDDLDTCHQQCSVMLREGKERDAASVMMADIAFRRNDYDKATQHFQQILQDKPDHYDGLARVIELLRRAGKLEDCPQYLEAAEKSSRGRASLEPGYSYCAGLYAWYTGSPNDALRHFNKARKDARYGTDATYNMVEICLNPDAETLGGSLFDGGATEGGADAAAKQESERAALKTADMLLRENKPKPGDLRHFVLGKMLIVLTKNRSNIEQTLSNLTQLTDNGIDSIGIQYVKALANTLIKQTQQSNQVLKALAKSAWNADEANYLEASWLLLADSSIQADNLDLASQLLQRCLEYNKSCARAYEYLGYVCEKQQSFKDAAKNYELAWKYGSKNIPAVGYKLAFNYLKAKRNVDAIDICNHVLKSHPNYPRIRQDILEKARMALRS